MAFDPIVTNPGRLRILTTLAAGGVAEFVALRQRTRLTDGNLSAHARRLESAGLISVEKHFRGGRPVTSFRLTHEGRHALERHARELLAMIRGTDDAMPVEEHVEAHPADDWVD